MQAADGFITLDKWTTVYYFEAYNAMFSYKEKKRYPVNWDNSEGRITGQMQNAPYIDFGVLLHHLLYREHFSFL